MVISTRLKAFALLFTVIATAPAQASIVISQIYPPKVEQRPNNQYTQVAFVAPLLARLFVSAAGRVAAGTAARAAVGVAARGATAVAPRVVAPAAGLAATGAVTSPARALPLAGARTAVTGPTTVQPRGMRNPVVRNSATYGRQMHQQYDYGPGVRREVSIANGRYRIDAVDERRGIIYELKPSNARAIHRGIGQVERNRRIYEAETGRRYISRVVTYRKPMRSPFYYD